MFVYLLGIFHIFFIDFDGYYIIRTDERQPRPKYIFNKCGTNIYWFTLQKFGPSPSPNFKSHIIIGSIISFHAFLFHFFQGSDQYVSISQKLWGIWDFSIIADSGRRWFVVLKRTSTVLKFPPPLKKMVYCLTENILCILTDLNSQLNLWNEICIRCRDGMNYILTF